MSEPHAAAISADKKDSNQDHRSGPNFEFLPTLPSSGTLTVTITGTASPDLVKGVVYKDNKLSRDEKIADISNGSTFDAAKAHKDSHYYIGDPSGATENFIVYFSE